MSISKLSPLTVPARLTRPQVERDEIVDRFEPSEERGLFQGVMMGALALSSFAASAQVVLAPAPTTQSPAQALIEGPSPELARALSKFDPGVLRLLHQEGLTIKVVRPGMAYAELGVHQERSVEGFQKAMPQMQAQAEAVRQAAQPFDQALKPLLAERAALGPISYVVGRAPTALELKARQLDDEIVWLKRDKRQATQAVMQPGSLAVPFRIPSLAGHMGDSDGLHQMVAAQSKIKSLADMARLVGARTPEQIKLYTDLVESINGPNASAQDPNLLVPDLYFMADGRGGTVLSDVDSAYGFSGWADSKGLTAAKSQVKGQFFPWANRILIQSNRLQGTTPAHEVGHALEEVIAQRDPRFYNNWVGKAQAAYQRALEQRSTITEYARTNLAEYIAEAVAHGLENPAHLKAQDPAAAELVNQLLTRAAQLAALPR